MRKPSPPDGSNPGFSCRRTELPLDHRHGRHALAEVAALDAAALAALCNARVADVTTVPVPPAAPLFFDTETTSLATGAGVLVFLVGLAWAARDRFIVEQYFLDDPGAERAFLEAAAARIAAAPLLCSFAGRGFDEPRLEDRYRFARLPSPFSRGRHADVLPVARALWRARLGSCALGAIEGARLGFRRSGDLPGAACPEAYFRFLRGDPAAREAVLEHNLMDLLSTAALAVAATARAGGAADPAESLGLARLERRRGRTAAALALLARAEAADASTRALTGPERRDLLLESAAALKRAGRHEEAAARWRAAAAPPNPSIEALIELAKHAEHRTGDHSLAACCAAEALSMLRCRRVDWSEARRAAVEAGLVRRLARLQARAARRAPPTP